MGAFSAVPRFSVWGYFPPFRVLVFGVFSAVLRFHVLGSPLLIAYVSGNENKMVSVMVSLKTHGIACLSSMLISRSLRSARGCLTNILISGQATRFNAGFTSLLLRTFCLQLFNLYWLVFWLPISCSLVALSGKQLLYFGCPKSNSSCPGMSGNR